MKRVAGCGKGHGRTYLSCHFSFFYNFGSYKTRRRLNLSFLSFFFICTSGVGFFVFSAEWRISLGFCIFFVLVAGAL